MLKRLPSHVAAINIPNCISPFAKRLYKNKTASFGNICMLSFSLFLGSMKADAQCNTFQNADSANPVLAALQPGETITSLDFVDIDGDGDADCYIVPQTGLPQLLRNIGTPQHPVYQKSTASGFSTDMTTPEGSPIIQFVDIDKDGDYDCFITELSFDFRPITGIRFYRNTGNKNNPQFTEDEDNNPVGFARSANNYVQFTFADMDKDGDADLYYTGSFNSAFGDYDQFTYLNNGGSNPSFSLYSNEHPHDFRRQRTYYDWNKDGLPDYIKYDNTQDIYSYFKNVGPLWQPQYMMDASNAPQFTNVLPYRIVDLNNDGTPEAFSATGNYATIAPVAMIAKDVHHAGNVTVTRLYSVNQQDGYRYRWEFDGKALPASSKPFIYAIMPGKYVLYIINDCGTGVSLPFTLTGKQWSTNSSMIADKLNASPLAPVTGVQVLSYPNPFVSTTTVKLPSTGGSFTVKVTDAAGRIILSQTTAASQLQVGQSLQRGTYLLQVWQKDQVIYTSKLVKE